MTERLTPNSADSTRAPDRRKPRRARGRLLPRVMGAFATASISALAAGFFWFLAQVPDEEVHIKQRADGIVVFTGGASRIADAMELLADGRGRRLLISGVYPGNSTGDVTRSLPDYAKLIECCVDLDRFATNTRGNAKETARWTRERGFQSLIVVTSNYHMPRALAELSQGMPDVMLIPFPVISEHWRTGTAMGRGARARLLLSEFAKLVFSELRARFGRDVTAVTIRQGPEARAALR